MSEVRPQPVYYNGQHYASTIEARIAVFLEMAGTKPRYELKQYNSGNSVIYTPDFLVQDAYIAGTSGRRYIWIEGKEALWSKTDEIKMARFSGVADFISGVSHTIEKPLLVMNGIPKGDTPDAVHQDVQEESAVAMDILDEHYQPIGKSCIIFPFNGALITGEHGPIAPCVKRGGGLYLGDIFDSDVDVTRTISAYRRAKEIRFKPATDSLYKDDYEFEVAEVVYDDKQRGRVKYPGVKLIMMANSGAGQIKVITRLHLIGSQAPQKTKAAYEWKVKDFCACIGEPFSQRILDKESKWFWDSVVGKRGFAWIKAKTENKDTINEVKAFWHADGSKPEGFDGAAEWERRHG